MVFKSIVPSVDIPSVDVASFCIGASRANIESADTVAYYDLGTKESQTFGQLETAHAHIGSGLVNRLNVQPREVVAVFAANTVHYASIVLGIISSGAICCTVSSAFREGELEYQLKDCGARTLFVGAAQLRIVLSVLDAGHVDIRSERIVVVGDPACGSGFTPLHRLLDARPYQKFRISGPEAAAETPAVIVYSSGTTGLPKGVVLSHRNLVACAVLNAASFQFQAAHGPSNEMNSEESAQRSIAILPFAHIYGLTSLVTNSVAGGRTQYVMSGRFSVDAFLQAIQDHRIHVASVVPSVLSQIAKHEHLARYDLSSLRILGSGAAALPSGVHASIRRRFAVSAANGYGMSETSSGVCVMANYKFAPGSVGILNPNMEARIVEPGTGRELGVGEEGEFCVRGPSVMLGYLNRPEETRGVVDDEGFLHTGDIAYIDASGLVFITDCIKELIKYKGMQIAPAELESILMDHPGVADAAVIGVDDPGRNSEVPMALVVPAQQPADAAELGREIAAWVAARVADHKRLRGGVVMIDAIPRNHSGKILHRDLRARFNAQRAAKI
ncbi:hypothetical protein IWW50_000054 [Coemansia erecta]|nr:hypothetical protein GGF43_000175 [Coemansia sp. RSA 2618]KAJ2830833.1 hypothetical protein IWW50_000054 [Coemansia erecta]